MSNADARTDKGTIIAAIISAFIAGIFLVIAALIQAGPPRSRSDNATPVTLLIERSTATQIEVIITPPLAIPSATPIVRQAEPPTQPPNTQLPVCQSAYDETGKGATKVWSLDIGLGCTLVYGGYYVNDVIGVYGAYEGPADVTLRITDGLYAIVPTESGQQEYCDRIAQALSRGQVVRYRHPAPTWELCP